MITKTAWKNIWRNKVRSLVVIASVTIGIFCGVFAIGVMEGAMKQRVNSALENEVSHIQITHPDFRSNNDLEYNIEKAGEVQSRISQIEGIESVASRTVLIGMANTASQSQGVQINGIVPGDEQKVFTLYDKIAPETGSYFNDEKGDGFAYIGADLAKSLNIIRYIVDEDLLERLREQKVPERTIDKLKQFEGRRFKNEKKFKRELKMTLDHSEDLKYSFLIRKEAENFSNRARLTLTFLNSDNYMTGGRFRIAGLYDIPNSMYENMQVFILQDQLQEMIGIDNQVHQLIVKLKDKGDTEKIADELSILFPELEVMTWQKLAPDLAMMSEMTGIIYGFFMGIILAALAFGIVNTMLMVVLERTKELGMLTAIGMNKKKVFRMIMTESVLLSLCGGIVGIILGKVLISVSSKNGINLSSMQEGFEGMGISSVIYPDIEPEFFVLVVILIIVTGILSSIYPALKALKLDPAEALRTE
jgi:ABC-type lipoprotein release transport system permease subunit